MDSYLVIRVKMQNELSRLSFPVGKIAEKAVCKSVFLTIWHCILSAELTKHALLQTAFSAILPTGLYTLY